jgi:hypothetical protein
MGLEQSTFNQAANACICDCDSRKDAAIAQRQEKAGSATPRVGFPGFERMGQTVSNRSTATGSAAVDERQDIGCFEEIAHSVQVYFSL